MNERSIFMEALDKDTLAQRSAFLDETCGGDTALRQRVEALLQSHGEAGSFLGKPVPERLSEKLAGSEGSAPTQGESSAEDHGDDGLEFLTPSDKPDSLGRLGHYEILEVIGRGGMGIVLRAFDEKLHRVVAIKVMAAQLAINATARKRFTREAQAAAAVTHDHIVTIHAVEEANVLPYLVMQYVSGMSLQQRLDSNGPLDLLEIIRIGMQTAAGLAAAHAHGMIHRDIKPANILLENGVERVKITDFGLARAVADASLTQSGVVAGTPQYMSPEQARGEAVDQRTDLFSLGSLLYAMCTGRPPFRADSSMAVLKRVCEDTPSPIQESNPDIPEWLVALIDKLQAKAPADRFQSAAEVAELLKGHLAHLQHPSVAPLPVWVAGAESSKPRSVLLAGASKTQPRPNRRRLVVAAAIFLCFAAGLSLTEATGVTSLRATVIRIFTPEGTLIVEVDDPGVKVTIEGDGGLVITGAGLQEVRLKPGSYKVQAAKDGKPVRLDQELVTIKRGDKQVVRVRLEGEAAAAKVAAKGEPGAFVLLGAKDVVVRKFDTLAEAVQGAADGDTIEIRGNGPFVMKPLTIRKALTIRAGAGFRPVIKMRPEGMQETDRLLEAQGPLIVQGLEFHVMFHDIKNQGYPEALRALDALHVVNCRFLTTRGKGIVSAGAVCEVRNCEFLCAVRGYSVIMTSPLNRLVIDNYLLTESLGDMNPKASLFRLSRSTFLTGLPPLWLVTTLGKAPKAEDADQHVKAMRVEATGNVFDPGCVFLVRSDLPKGVLPTGDWESLLAKQTDWKGERNLFAGDGPLVALAPPGKHYDGTATKTLADWRRLWGTAEANSIRNVVRYQGGDPRAMVELAPEKVTPDDFRLRADSAGYRAGKDGKDLGADVDLVGPGLAYERWKKTPEYQQWLKDTKQVKKAEWPTAEPKAFVVLGGKGVAERKFDALPEAVQGAINGDTIEVRGNGPFVSSAIDAKGTELTIRAAGGFHPVIKLSMEGLDKLSPFIATSAPLILEGLDIQGIGPTGPWSGIGAAAEGAPLYVANCRLHLREAEALLGNGTVHIRNCELLGHGNCFGVTFDNGSKRRIIMENCVRVGFLAFYFNHAHSSNKVSIQLKRNTLITNVTWLYDLQLVPEFPKGQLDQAPKLVDVDASENIFDALSMLQFNQAENFLAKSKMLSDAEATALFVRLVSWREQRNLYADGNAAPTWDIKQCYSPKTVAEWKRLWRQTDSESRVGRVKYQGGNLRSKLDTDAHLLTPDDFRLRADSAGYRAGKDKKDLGADVDLVGPGPAYERWKKTREYQQWLKDTKQVK